MADEGKKKKKAEKSKIVLERVYNIPLRKEFLKTPRYKRAKKCIRTIKEFLKKHMKAEEVMIGKHLNLEIWKHGIKNPPHHVKVTAKKDDKNIVKTELFGVKEDVKESKKKEVKKVETKEEKKIEEKVVEKKDNVEEKKTEEKVKEEEPKVEEKKTEIKEPKKKSTKELQKEIKEKLEKEKEVKKESPTPNSKERK